MFDDTKHPWASQAQIFHVFPLGLCGAPSDHSQEIDPVSRFPKLLDWIGTAQGLGCNTVLFGPFWESRTHGYDTTDLTCLDRRLGTRQDLFHVLASWKNAGFRLIFDGVFHHVGRDFPAFRDLLQNLEASRFAGWFSGVDFTRRSPWGDPFAYEGWAGHFDLVKLNLHHPEVRSFLLDAVGSWVRDFDLDGLRLDAADAIDKDFLRDLAAHCRSLKPDFWLVGEVVHGNYRDWTDLGLDSVTNYEVYKGLWSSHNDANYHEIAWSLNRQFGSKGIYQGLRLLSFAENHDVNRVASTVTDPAHLYPLHLLLFAAPGLPCLYYGQEKATHGARTKESDSALRPYLSPSAPAQEPALEAALRRFASLRRTLRPLQGLGYEQAHVAASQLAFWRWDTPEDRVLVAVNSDSKITKVTLNAPDGPWRDALDPAYGTKTQNGRLEIEIPPCWGRVLTRSQGPGAVPWMAEGVLSNFPG